VDDLSTHSQSARLCVRREYLAGTGTDRKGSIAMSLLSVEEAAVRLGTGPRFVRRLIAERRIPFVKLGRHVRLDTADLDAYVAAGRVEPTDRRLEGSAP
jgi:excisionase family DNA binding protein